MEKVERKDGDALCGANAVTWRRSGVLIGGFCGGWKWRKKLPSLRPEKGIRE